MSMPAQKAAELARAQQLPEAEVKGQAEAIAVDPEVAKRTSWKQEIIAHRNEWVRQSKPLEEALPGLRNMRARFEADKLSSQQKIEARSKEYNETLQALNFLEQLIAELQHREDSLKNRTQASFEHYAHKAHFKCFYEVDKKNYDDFMSVYRGESHQKRLKDLESLMEKKEKLEKVLGIHQRAVAHIEKMLPEIGEKIQKAEEVVASLGELIKQCDERLAAIHIQDCKEFIQENYRRVLDLVKVQQRHEENVQEISARNQNLAKELDLALELKAWMVEEVDNLRNELPAAPGGVTVANMQAAANAFYEDLRDAAAIQLEQNDRSRITLLQHIGFLEAIIPQAKELFEKLQAIELEPQNPHVSISLFQEMIREGDNSIHRQRNELLPDLQRCHEQLVQKLMQFPAAPGAVAAAAPGGPAIAPVPMVDAGQKPEEGAREHSAAAAAGADNPADGPNPPEVLHLTVEDYRVRALREQEERSAREEEESMERARQRYFLSQIRHAMLEKMQAEKEVKRQQAEREREERARQEAQQAHWAQRHLEWQRQAELDRANEIAAQEEYNRNQMEAHFQASQQLVWR